MAITNLWKFLQNEGLKKYLANTSWLILEWVVNAGVGLIVGIWMARYLGPAGYGVLEYSQSFVEIFGVFATLGLEGIVIRDIIKYPEQRDRILGTAFALQFVGSLAVVMIIVMLQYAFPKERIVSQCMVILSCVYLFQGFSVISYYFQSKVLSKYVVFSNIIALSAAAAVKSGLIISRAPLVLFACAIAGTTVISAAALICFFSRRSGLSILRWKFCLSCAIQLLKDSWPLILTGLTIALYMKIDKIMIKEMMGNYAIGQYAVAVNLSEIWYFIPMAISSSFYPAIINAKKVDIATYPIRIKKLFSLLTWISLCASVIVTLFGKMAVSVFYGEQYPETAGVLIIHIWSGIFVSLSMASGQWYLIENLQKLAFFRMFYGMIGNIILNMILIPVYGIKGAAFATLISYLFTGLLFDFFNSKTRQLFWLKIHAFDLRNIFN